MTQQLITRQQGAALFTEFANQFGQTDPERAAALGATAREVQSWRTNRRPIGRDVCARMGLRMVVDLSAQVRGLARIVGYRRIEE